MLRPSASLPVPGPSFSYPVVAEGCGRSFEKDQPEHPWIQYFRCFVLRRPYPFRARLFHTPLWPKAVAVPSKKTSQNTRGFSILDVSSFGVLTRSGPVFFIPRCGRRLWPFLRKRPARTPVDSVF